MRNAAQYRFLSNLEFLGQLDFEFRTFKDTTSRKDQLFGLGMGTKYYFHPDFSTDLRFKTRNMGSSEEVYGYRKSEIIMGLQLEL